MGLCKGVKKIMPYKGNYGPVNVYRGTAKVAGWLPSTQTGKALAYEGTYKDKVSPLGVYGWSSQVQTTQGKNLFDTNRWNTFLTANETSHTTPNKTGTDGGYTYLAVHPNGHYNLQFMKGEFQPNTQYTISFMARQESVKAGVTTGFVFNYTDGTYSIRYCNNDTTWAQYTLTSTANKTIDYIGMAWNYGGYVYFANIQHIHQAVDRIVNVNTGELLDAEYHQRRNGYP